MSVRENITDLIKTGKAQEQLGAEHSVLHILGLGTTTTDSLQIVQPDQIRPWGCGLISVGDIKYWLKANEQSFKEHLVKSLWRNGIAVTATLQICLIDEALAIKGGHIDQVKIEAVIREDVELYGHFRLLAATDSFLHAIDTNSEFAANYYANPEIAVLNFSKLFAPKRWTNYYLSTANLMGPLNSAIN